MKQRSGFVSNSSSSSFIVAFPKDIKLTVEAVKEYLFKDAETIEAGYDDTNISTEEASRIILSEMRTQSPNDMNNLKGSCEGGLDGSPDYEDFKRKDGGIDWKPYEEARDIYVTEVIDNLMKQHSTSDLYTFEFSDNDGPAGSILEHGGTFDRVPHLVISNH